MSPPPPPPPNISCVQSLVVCVVACGSVALKRRSSYSTIIHLARQRRAATARPLLTLSAFGGFCWRQGRQDRPQFTLAHTAAFHPWREEQEEEEEKQEEGRRRSRSRGEEAREEEGKRRSRRRGRKRGGGGRGRVGGGGGDKGGRKGRRR